MDGAGDGGFVGRSDPDIYGRVNGCACSGKAARLFRALFSRGRWGLTRNLDRTRNRGQDATVWGISDKNNPSPLRVDEDGNLYVNLVNPFSSGGEDDEDQLLLTDEITGALTTIELQHHEVHEGESFEASYFTLSLANNASIDFRLPAGAKYCHFVFDCSCGGNAEVQFYASANLSGGNCPNRMEYESPISQCRHNGSFSYPGGDRHGDAGIQCGVAWWQGAQRGGRRSAAKYRMDFEAQYSLPHSAFQPQR